MQPEQEKPRCGGTGWIADRTPQGKAAQGTTSSPCPGCPDCKGGEADWPEGETFVIWACPEPGCGEYDTERYHCDRASIACCNALHPPAVRLDLASIPAPEVQAGEDER